MSEEKVKVEKLNQRYCKKCKRKMAYGDKHIFCESCRNQQVDKFKKRGLEFGTAAILGVSFFKFIKNKIIK